MKFFDINTMIGEWTYNDLMFKTADGLAAEMRRLHIERAVTFHSIAMCHDPKQGNSALADEIKSHQNLTGAMILTPLIDIEFGGKENVVRFMRENRIGAIRLYPVDHSYFLERWNVEEIFALANEHAVPVLIDFRQSHQILDEYFDQIYLLAKEYANTPIVLLTIGYRRLRVLYKLFEKCPNIFIDTSTFITYRGVEDVVKHFGSARLLFGTRMPFIEGGVSVGRVLYADIPQADRENIAYNNTAALLAANLAYAGRCSE